MGEFSPSASDGLAGYGQELSRETPELAFAQKIVVADDANAVAVGQEGSRPPGWCPLRDASPAMEGLRIVAEIVALEEFAEGAGDIQSSSGP